MVCTNFCYIPNPCSTIGAIPEINLLFDARYTFRIAFSSVEDDVYLGRNSDGKCYIEIFDVGDTDLFQIGDPFFKEYYTVFSANNSTMGFGLSVERNQIGDVIDDKTPLAPEPQPMPLPANEPKPDALAPTPSSYIGPTTQDITKPDGWDKNVVPTAAGVTAGGIFIFLVVVMSYYFFCRKERPAEQTAIGVAMKEEVDADGRVRITGMNPRFGDLNSGLTD